MLAPLVGSSVFLASAAARSREQDNKTSDVLMLGLGAVVGAAVSFLRISMWSRVESGSSVLAESVVTMEIRFLARLSGTLRLNDDGVDF